MTPTLPRLTSLPRLTLIALAAVLLAATAQAGSLEETLARLDKSAAAFRGLTAGVRVTSYTAIVKETTEETGKITIYRPKPRDLAMLVEFVQPSPRAVAFQGRKVQMYYPKLQVVREYDLGKQSGLVDQYLLLGFGTPGSELKKSYTLKFGGEETLNGVKTDRLELVPLGTEAVKHVRMFEIWVSQQDGIVVQQKLHQPSRDFMLFTYTDMKLNPALTASSVALNLPKGVKKETPQK
jgi:outer membrane lipoprotein-sorting protein